MRVGCINIRWGRLRLFDADMNTNQSEVGWLIESTHPCGRPRWMAALVGVGRWTGNAACAIRFDSKRDADLVIDSLTQNGLAGPGFATATEHQWG